MDRLTTIYLVSFTFDHPVVLVFKKIQSFHKLIKRFKVGPAGLGPGAWIARITQEKIIPGTPAGCFLRVFGSAPGPPGCCPFSPANNSAGWGHVSLIMESVFPFFGYVFAWGGLWPLSILYSLEFFYKVRDRLLHNWVIFSVKLKLDLHWGFHNLRILIINVSQCPD